MFNHLTHRLSRALNNVIRYKFLDEDNIRTTLREVRIALLEADVALSVVHDFINRVKNKAIGSKIDKVLTPGQNFIKIVYNELIVVMGEEHQGLNLSTQSPTIILLAGMQGSGKTTSIGKLSKFICEKYKKRILAVSVDIYRPAAITQLDILLQQIKNAELFNLNIQNDNKPINIIQAAFKKASLELYDVLLVDTAGCLDVDTRVMDEIKEIHTFLKPTETLFVIDAMVGQDAVNIAKMFNEAIPLTGIILTKADGDARGGSALSVRYITGKPIKFLGIGEKIDALEPFYPERIASNILGMGDMLSLIEDIESKCNHTKINELTNKLKRGDNLNFIDLLEQLHQIKHIGGMDNIINKLPAINQLTEKIKTQMNDKVLSNIEAIINSMTLEERLNPAIINHSRKRRIALGCGISIQEINYLLKQMTDMQRVIKHININGGISTFMHNIKEILLSGLPK